MIRELDDFINRINRNCDISDAGSVGLYSICGLALRLRDLYKWENGLHPWVEKDSSQMLNWIDKKERLWEKIASDDFEKLPLFGKAYDPFDTEAVNQTLSPHGLFYGAGYAHSLKPTFFLSEIEKKQTINGFNVLILKREVSRDLLTLPALNQDRLIIVRKQSALQYLWDQMAYLTKSGRPALAFALKHTGLPDHQADTRKRYLDAIFSVQKETYIYHEIGELEASEFDEGLWRDMISQFPHTAVELFARTIKDLLADTGPTGTLNRIIQKQNMAGLGFYAAFIDGMAKVLFPEIRLAFKDFMETGDWDKIKQARIAGFSNAAAHADEMTRVFKAGKKKDDMEWVRDTIHKKLIDPIIN